MWCHTVAPNWSSESKSDTEKNYKITKKKKKPLLLEELLFIVSQNGVYHTLCVPSMDFNRIKVEITQADHWKDLGATVSYVTPPSQG